MWFYSAPETTKIHYTIDIQSCRDSGQVLYFQPGDNDGEPNATTSWYCLSVQDPAELAQDIVYAAVAVMLFLTLTISCVLLWKIRAQPIQNASPLICFCILAGIAFSSISVLMWNDADDAKCSLRGWLLVIGNTLMFGSLCVREGRMLWIFKIVKAGRKRVITNMDLFKGLLAILAINLLLLVVWTAVAPPIRVSDIHIGREDSITYECDVSSPSGVFVILLIVIQALLLAFDCVVAFLLRNTPSSFNESKHVAFTIYNAAVMMIVTIVLVIVFNDDKTTVLIIVAAVSLFFFPLDLIFPALNSLASNLINTQTDGTVRMLCLADSAVRAKDLSIVFEQRGTQQATK